MTKKETRATNRKHPNIKKIVSVSCFDLAPSFATGVEIHESWEFVYVDKGEVICQGDGYEVKLSQGDIIFHSPCEPHLTVCNGKESASIFSVIFNVLGDMSFFNKRLMKTPKKLASLFKNLIGECERAFVISEYPLKKRADAFFGSERLALLYLEEFLILLMRKESEKQTPDEFIYGNKLRTDGIAQKIAAYLEDKIFDSVSLGDIVKKFHFGKSYLCKEFKDSFGVSIMNYHLALKISEAKKLLRESDMQICEIAKALGFENPEYFSRYFKKITGHAPREFRGALINDASLKKK